jgi:hypothetical protein
MFVTKQNEKVVKTKQLILTTFVITIETQMSTKIVFFFFSKVNALIMPDFFYHLFYIFLNGIQNDRGKMYTHNLFHWFKTTNHVFNSSSLI